MHITLQLSDDVARALVDPGIPNANAGALSRLAGELKLDVRPLHPGTDDPALSRYFVVDVADDAQPERALLRLRGSPGVLAAYVKPPDAMP